MEFSVSKDLVPFLTKLLCWWHRCPALLCLMRKHCAFRYFILQDDICFQIRWQANDVSSIEVTGWDPKCCLSFSKLFPKAGELPKGVAITYKTYKAGVRRWRMKKLFVFWAIRSMTLWFKVGNSQMFCRVIGRKKTHKCWYEGHEVVFVFAGGEFLKSK